MRKQQSLAFNVGLSSILVESGGQANNLITEGFVRYNGEIDTRKRLKLRKGDKIEFAEMFIRIY